MLCIPGALLRWYLRPREENLDTSRHALVWCIMYCFKWPFSSLVVQFVSPPNASTSIVPRKLVVSRLTHQSPGGLVSDHIKISGLRQSAGAHEQPKQNLRADKSDKVIRQHRCRQIKVKEAKGARKGSLIKGKGLGS